jgi:PhnB protein
MDTFTHRHPAAEVAEIRELMKDFGTAISAKDAARVMACGAQGSTHFLLAPPLIAPDDGGKALKDWFASWDGRIGYEFRNLEVHAGKHIGFCYGLVHLTGRKKDGEEEDVWYRVTFGVEKFGDEGWKIVHEHESVPFYMDGSLKAAVDLKP